MSDASYIKKGELSYMKNEGSPIILHRLALGYMCTNTYLYGHKDKKIAIIDPGFDADTIIDFISRNQYEPVAIILTHGHRDHTGIGRHRKTHRVPHTGHTTSALFHRLTPSSQSVLLR